MLMTQVLFCDGTCSLQTARKARPQRRTQAASKNPMRVLAARSDLQTQYDEVRTDIADRELKRIKREQSKIFESKYSGFPQI